jgi:uncharacterized protein
VPAAIMLAFQAAGSAALSSGPSAFQHSMLRLSYGALKLLPGSMLPADLGAERMVVSINNAALESSAPLAPRPASVLLLLPHCLQDHSCQVRIVHDTSGCRRCGACDVGSLLEMATRRGLAVAVATGGNLARKALRRWKPDLVLAVACPRDLCTGLLDAWPVPVWGQLNSLPNGECYDTRVDPAEIERALDLLTGPAQDGAVSP